MPPSGTHHGAGRSDGLSGMCCITASLQNPGGILIGRTSPRRQRRRLRRPPEQETRGLRRAQHGRQNGYAPLGYTSSTANRRWQTRGGRRSSKSAPPSQPRGRASRPSPEADGESSAGKAKRWSTASVFPGRRTSRSGGGCDSTPEAGTATATTRGRTSSGVRDPSRLTEPSRRVRGSGARRPGPSGSGARDRKAEGASKVDLIRCRGGVPAVPLAAGNRTADRAGCCAPTARRSNSRGRRCVNAASAPQGALRLLLCSVVTA